MNSFIYFSISCLVFLSAGFTDYLAKPIDKLELMRVLKENLDKKDK